MGNERRGSPLVCRRGCSPDVTAACAAWTTLIISSKIAPDEQAGAH